MKKTGVQKSRETVPLNIHWFPVLSQKNRQALQTFSKSKRDLAADATLLT
jgi:hypothetical protein